MKNSANFATWDFTTIWASDANKNNGYPYLRNNFDMTPPVFVRAEAIARNQVVAYFDEDIDYSALSVNDFDVSIDATIYPILSLAETNGVVTLTLSGELSSDTPTVTINPRDPSTIKDVWGNIESNTVSKVAVDKIRPTVVVKL